MSNENFVIQNEHLWIEKIENELWVESPDSWAVLVPHPVLIAQIEKEFSPDTTLGDIICIVQSLGFKVETEYIGEEEL